MRNLRAPQMLETQPGVVSAEDGHVFLDGPDGVAITLTPAAAVQMGERLIAAGKIASQQEATTQKGIIDRIY